MARHTIPQVIDDQLSPPDMTGGFLPTIQVGSADWYAWLNEATTRSFAYRSSQGFLTARRERRGDTLYWYAYRTRNGQLHKAYLGKAEELTALRLNHVAAKLSEETFTGVQEPDARNTTSSSVSTPLSSTSRFQTANLLMTKFYVPPARLQMVSRTHLMERLTTGLRSQLILLVAPAGYGKTTLLSTWQAGHNRPTWPLVWVSLDGGDNDPIRFWTYVITAINRLHAGLGETALTLLRSPQPPPIELVLTSLLNALTSVSTDMVLVLDDYHVIVAQPIHDALTFLLDHIPPHFHLIMASRVDPLLPLARLRARGSLTELRITDLRFTLEEVAAFLR